MNFPRKYWGIVLVVLGTLGLIVPHVFGGQTNVSLLLSWLVMLAGLVLFVVFTKYHT